MKNKTGNDKKRSVSANRLNNNNNYRKDNLASHNIQQQYYTENPEIIKEFQRGSDFINSLIHEYLLKRNYLLTLDTFQEEINTKLKTKQYSSTKFLQNTNQSQLESFFLTGKKSEFFKLWNRIIPSHLKAKEILLEKLEFFLQIYFAVFPILGEKKNLKENNFKEMKQRMSEFKAYLESKEVEMSKTTEYLAYYALPYIQNPREHPTYKQIFTTEWIKDLKDKLNDCFVNYLPNGKYPLLYDMFMLCESVNVEHKLKAKAKPLYNFLENFCYKNYTSDKKENNVDVFNDSSEVKNRPNTNVNNSEIRISDSNYNELLLNYNKLKKKEENTKLMLIESQKKWTNLSSDILKISFDLISHYKNLFTEETKTDQVIETAFKKLSRYETFLKKNAEELEKNQSFNKENEKVLYSKDNSRDNKQISQINNNNNVTHNQSDNDISLYNKTELVNNSIHIDYDPNFSIEMVLVRSDLAKVGSMAFNYQEFYDKLNFILREIRLRISRRKYTKLKQNTLCSVIMHDIFGIRSKHVKIYMNMLSNEKTVLETIKLMNAITNENKGRTYMLTKPSIIDEIVKIMMSQQGDTDVRQNCLGIIQKFTLRSEPQKRLIDLDVIMWITNLLLTESIALSEYTLEYGLALIMNLSLKSNGRDKCEKVSTKLLKIMISNLNSESLQVRTCVNGTLYSLLKRKKIKSEARSLGLEKLLNIQLLNPNEQMKKQIQYILEELNSEEEHEEKNDEEFEEDIETNEDEATEEEYYEEDSITDEMIRLHYHYLGLYIIKDPHENLIENQKISDFLNGLTSNNRKNRNLLNNNFSSSIRRDEYERPLRRPTTPMTNLSSTSNSQIFGIERKSLASKLKTNLKGINVKIDFNENSNIPQNNYNTENFIENIKEKDLEKIIIPSPKGDDKNNDIDNKQLPPFQNSVMAFEKKDKIPRTPKKSGDENEISKYLK